MKLLKSIYKIIPFKKNIFLCLKKFIKLPHHIYQHLYFKGIFNVKVDEIHQFKIKHYGYEIENEIFWQGLIGGWEKISIGLWIKLCQNSNVIIDIGANTGVYALIAKAICSNAKVFALEPVERVYQKLIENNNLNGFDIQCLPLAASNQIGEAIIYDIPELEHIYSVTVNRNNHNSETPIKKVIINSITLDKLVEQYAIQKVDLIKIDVETHEPEVIEGYNKYIALHRPNILIEILNDEVGIKVENMVTDLDYLYFNIDENKGIRKVEHILKSDYYNFLLCNHKTAKFLQLV